MLSRIASTATLSILLPMAPAPAQQPACLVRESVDTLGAIPTTPR
jgi:hypothetical protein